MSVRYPGQENPKIRILAPCGRCSACLVNYRNEWIIRIKEEAKTHEFSSFITLTYSDDFVTYGAKYETLVKEDFQLFMKRLRERLKFKIRFYALGEYGGKTRRPHYHAVIFGMNANDSEQQKQINEAWGKGFITMSPLTGRRIGYICKYHLNRGRYPEGSAPSFVLMSNKPGIGYSYVKDKFDFHRRGIDFAYYSDKGVKRALPRYYRLKTYLPNERKQMAEKLRDDFTLEAMAKFKANHPDSNYFKDRQSHYAALQANYEKVRKLNNKL